MSTFNLGDIYKSAGASGPADCPEGLCAVECVNAEAKTASTGKQMLSLRYRIVTGPYAGRAVRDNIVLTEDNPDAMVFFFTKLGALGLTDEDLLAQCAGTLKPLAAEVVGRRADVELVREDWHGETKAAIARYIGPSAGGPEADAGAGEDDDFGF